MSWLLAAFVSPILHGIANILDNYLANKLFTNVWTLTFYSSLLNVIFIPLVFLFQIPDLPPLGLWPLFVLIGVIQILYLFPYYKALQNEDTSIITALFSLGRIFVPVLAFLMVGEVLQPLQYVGFLIVIFASAALTLNGKKKLHFNHSLFYMIVCSLLVALEAVIYKYLFENVSWSTGLVWPLVFSFFIALCFLFVGTLRHDIRENGTIFKTNLAVFASGEIFSFLGLAASLYAISLAPVTLVKSIGSFQAFFVLLYAVVFHRLFPNVFKESVDRRNLLRKGLLFLCMILGVTLAIGQSS